LYPLTLGLAEFLTAILREVVSDVPQWNAAGNIANANLIGKS